MARRSMLRSIATEYVSYVRIKLSQRCVEANVTQLAGATESAASFQFDGEDHTLGNALRYIIMKK